MLSYNLRRPALMGWLTCLSLCGTSLLGEVAVTFDPPSLAHGSRSITAYSQNGVRFGGSLSNSYAHTDSGLTLFPNNGSAFISVSRAYTYFDMGGSAFTPKQVDLAEYSTVYARPAAATFKGYCQNGGTVTTTFTTDGVMDGSGALADFETFTFPASFSNVTKVEFVSLTVPFSLDNLTLAPASAAVVTLRTEGSPLACGTPLPFGYGVATLNSGTPVTNRVASPIEEGSGTRHVCTGVTVLGNAFAQAGPTNVTLTITNDTTLTWNWQTQYRLTAGTSGEGTLTAAAEWQNAGTQVVLVASAATNWTFAGWQGDTNGCALADETITVPMAQARTLTALFTSAPGFATPGLVLWNRLGSATEVGASAVGANGLDSTGVFVPGVFGNAMELSTVDRSGVSFPASVLPRSSGCLEFWAQISDISGYLSAGPFVSLANISDVQGSISHSMSYAANDGSANGGLCARLGNIGSAGTGAYGYMWTYTSALKGASPAVWHHYALVWGIDGIPCLTNPVRRMAVYVDGALNTGSWIGAVVPPGPLVLPQNGKLGLLYLHGLTSGRLAVDNVKIWNYAKTDFSDRFTEGSLLPPVTLTVSGALSSAQPANGAHAYANGESISASVASPVTDGSTRYVCTGAAVVGNAFTQLSLTNVTLTLTNSATLTWSWSTEYRIEASSEGHGTVAGSGWFVAGTNAVLTATPDAGYQFSQWSDGVQSASRTVVVPQGGDAFTATFSPLPRGVLRFAKPRYSVAESANTVKLTVERASGSYGAASVSYVSANGTAAESSDFGIDLNTLTWKDGESASKSFYVDILDDDLYEGNESFTVQLTDASGASLGSPETAAVTIVDNEGVPSRIPRFAGNLNFGEVPTNRSAALAIQIWNDGNLPLSVTNVLTPSGFTASPQVFTVAAGEMASLSVQFAPLELRAYADSVSLCCNATTGSTSVAVSGTGILPPPVPATRRIEGLTARIAVIVPENAAALGVEDQLPPGMTPVTIANSGTWDAVNRKVKWFFNEPGQIRNRVLQYTVDGAGSVVTGWVNFGSGSQPVVGATAFEGPAPSGLLHPADDNGDWRIALGEVSASIARWRSGVDELKTPVAVRGITLYLQGELYRYDALVSSEPKRWKPTTESLALSCAAAETHSDATGTLQLYAGVLSGTERWVALTNITLTVTPPSGTLAWGLEESIPAGVDVTAISDSGSWDGIHRLIKWSFSDGTERTLTYTLSGPAGVSVTVTGNVSFDGSEDAVTGSSLAVVPLPFQTWATRRGLEGDPVALFHALNAEYGQPNGLVYAFQPNLQPDVPLLSIRWLNGLPMIETPKQDEATVPFVEVTLTGTTSLAEPDWSLELAPAEDQSSVPDNRYLWVPLSFPDRAFYKLRATLK